MRNPDRPKALLSCNRCLKVSCVAGQIFRHRDHVRVLPQKGTTPRLEIHHPDDFLVHIEGYVQGDHSSL